MVNQEPARKQICDYSMGASGRFVKKWIKINLDYEMYEEIKFRLENLDFRIL